MSRKPLLQPSSDTKEQLIKEELQTLKLPCAGCPSSGKPAHYPRLLIFCGVNVAAGLDSYISFAEARLCPGEERRTLFVNAPAHYAKRRSNTS